MPNLKELSHRTERLLPGHRLCPGCGASIAVRQVLLGTTNPVVVGAATGCLEVATSIYPYTAWNCPFIHNAFENVASTISGAETAYRILKQKKRVPSESSIKFVAFGGDGGSYDIGLQALSGALERRHNFVYVCYDNEAYMNTGIQRSGATPAGASTTTAPAGRESPGKLPFRKDLTEIVVAHNIPYAAQSTIGYWKDLVSKSEKAFRVEGPAFINVLAMCHRGWRFKQDDTIKVSRLAVETCFWPLYEVANGAYRLTYRPREKKPITDWLESQGRFKHLFKPENRHMIDSIQEEIDKRWKKILYLCGEQG
jgi:pyruvate ferredoxin oxidoreductase beta subunit